MPADWEDVQTNAFAIMARYHRTMQSEQHHGLAKTVLKDFNTMHEWLSEFLSVGLEFYVITDYMSRYDTANRHIWASEFH